MPWIPAQGQTLGALIPPILVSTCDLHGERLIPVGNQPAGLTTRSTETGQHWEAATFPSVQGQTPGKVVRGPAARRAASTDFTHGHHALQSPHVPSQVGSCFCSQGPLGVRKYVPSTGRFISMPNLLINKPGKSKKCH